VKSKNRLFFLAFLILVAALEGAILFYGRFEPVKATSTPKPRKVAIHICACKVKPEPVPPKIQPPKPPEPKPVVKPKPKPKPKPKKKKKKKKKVKKRPVPKKEVVVQKTPPPPPPKPAPPPPPPPAPAPAPVVQAPPQPVVDMAALERAKANYLAQVRTAIETHKYYPRIARKMHQTGTVEVRFCILSDGTIRHCEVLTPCRYRKLNKAALKTLKRVGRFPPIPKILDVSQMRISVPIRYSLK